ncbi:MAG TPA: hypothetical protein PJ992_08090 [Arachnia sp.]|nr:hypothetical protein [Arachnia sp.]
MSRAAIAIRHVGFEDLGLLGPLNERGLRIGYLVVGIDNLVDARAADAEIGDVR